jgi:hypothetical protein
MAFADNGGGTPRPVKIATNIGKVAKKAATTVGNTVRASKSNRSSGSSGGSNRGSSGGGSTRTPSRPSTPVKPKPAPVKPAVPSIDAYLGTDSTYQDVLRGGKRTLQDFLSDLTRRKGEAGTQFNTTLSSMNRDRDQQLAALRDEFASRGLIQSGLFGEEQGRFQQQFTDQMGALQQQQTGLLADLLSQETNFKREQQLAQEAAKQEALQRRVAKYNIGG